MGSDMSFKFDKGDVIIERGNQRVIIKTDGSLNVVLTDDKETFITLKSDGNIAIGAKELKYEYI